MESSPVLWGIASMAQSQSVLAESSGRTGYTAMASVSITLEKTIFCREKGCIIGAASPFAPFLVAALQHVKKADKNPDVDSIKLAVMNAYF